MIDVESWAEIRRLHKAEQLSIKEIVRQTGHARNTVREALRSDAAPKYSRDSMGSSVNAYEAEIRRLLKATPTMPGTVVAERIGWPGGMTVLYERLREIRPEYAPADPAGRSTYEPGELAQWDLWFPPADIPLEDHSVVSPPVLVGVSGYSRYLTAEMIPTRAAHDILVAHWHLLVRLGGVPRAGVYDGEAALSSRKGHKVTLSDAFQVFRGTLGMGVIINKPRDPESKGVVERHNGYLETSFLPGRKFGSPADFNEQLQDWLDTRANVRIHATLRCRPIDRLEEDRAAMLDLPPTCPPSARVFSVRLGRDHWVRVDTCDYSVHPRFIGLMVEVRVDVLSVRITGPGRVAAGAHKRSWARHQTVTDPAHIAAGDQMRAAYRRPSAAPVGTEVELRDLASYDELWQVEP